ncbi:hypothetical protein CPB85DRAFT_1247101 [Mucidula mucida]|nr:hypothetical protein CPB85DRAFT_1247101 [Mucidula mucida]
MLSSFAAFAHAVTSQTLQLLYSLIPGQQAALQVVVFVIEITLFSVFLLLFLCACVALVLCLLLNIAVLLHPCLRGRIAEHIRRQLDLIDDLPADELTRWIGARRPVAYPPSCRLGSVVAVLVHYSRRCLAVVLLWQLPNFDNLAEEHDPSFIKWLRDDGDLVVTHIGRSGPYMAINRAILLTIGDDGVVESFRKGPVSNYVDKLGKLTWVNCCLKISIRDFDKVVGWRRDRRWVRNWIDLVIENAFHFSWSHVDPLYDPKSRPLSRVAPSLALNKLSAYGSFAVREPARSCHVVLGGKAAVLEKQSDEKYCTWRFTVADDDPDQTPNGRVSFAIDALRNMLDI